MVRTQAERLAEKTVERQFLYELESDFELAPATSRALLSAAQQVLLSGVRAGEVREGQMRVTVVGSREPAGKPLAAMQKVSVVVTVDDGLEDLDGVDGARRDELASVARATDDRGSDGSRWRADAGRSGAAAADGSAHDPSGRSRLRGEGHWVPTRGAVQDTGRGQSHKAKIVEMYLQRMTYSEIVRRARHSAASVKRYVQTFGRVLVLWQNGIVEAGQVAFVVGISERLAREYLDLRQRYVNAQYADRLEEIARQARRALPRNGEEKGGC